MFLFERIFGIGVYMLILLCVCFFMIKTNLSCKLILKFYLICLCIMAFFYKPYITADLYRIFEQMEYFATMEFDFFWNNFALESSTPLSRLLFWVLGKTGINELLPMFSAFVCYSCIFYIINKTQKMYNISKQSVACVLFFVMTTSIYISVVGGIRMMLALSMIAFSYYRSIIEKKLSLIDIVFYVASIFIHAMSIVVIIICACALLFGSGKNVLRKIVYLFGIGVIGGIFAIKFTDVLHGVYQKFLEFVLGDKYSDAWEYVMGVIIILILLLMYAEFRRVKNNKDFVRVKGYNLVSVFSIVLAVCFCFEFSIFYRFGAHVAVLFSIPSLMVSIEKTKGQTSAFFARVDYRTIFVLLSLVMAVISCSRGSLCSLKFFEF